MLFEDIAANGCSFAKDPCVILVGDSYFMYYSKPIMEGDEMGSLSIGIARSEDLENWHTAGTLYAEQEAEGKGIGAPGAIVRDGVVHLFYQSYGQFPRDFICHATSEDGIHFMRDETNPVVMPEGSWNNGRAIDADVVIFNGKLFLYWATRDPAGEVQMLGVSVADGESGFHREDFVQCCDAPVLKPELPWEQMCIEAPAALARDGKVYLFYAGAYNCAPQQIGCAVSSDGVHFMRLFDKPLLAPGPSGSWNACESGHPYVFEDRDGEIYLFYQGSDDMGRTWRLSRKHVRFSGGMPVLDDMQPRAGNQK